MRRSIGRVLGAWLVATGALVVGVIPPTSAATCQSWGAQPPSPGTNNNDLLAVTVLSACNAWAVGTRSDTPLATQTLIEHWNGTAWTVVPSPSPSDVSNELAAVGASSPKDMWAVGYSSNGTSFRPLIEHYNGLGWRAVRAPHTGTGGGLVGIVAFGKKEAWAVGSTTLASGGTRELIEHWNGRAWKIQASPTVGTENGFVGGIDGSSPKDIWVVGYRGRFGESASTTLIEHWNGTAWKVVKAPNGSDFTNQLSAVSVVSPSDAWAAGYSDAFGKPSRTLLEHWNGHAWKKVASPSPGSILNTVSGLAMTSRTNGWAVGTYQPAPAVFKTLVERWNGHRWVVEPSENLGPEDSLLAVGADANDDAWAVGHVADVVWQALALHCC